MDHLKIKLNQQVLVLNADFNPINICDAQRAIVLILKDKAKVVTERIIRLIDFVKIPFTRMMTHKPSRNMIHRRDSYECQYCSAKENLTIDHVLPSSRGGSSTWENLVSCCTRCNTKKGNRTPDEAGLKLKKVPKAPINKVHLTIQCSNLDEWKTYLFN